MLLAAFPFGETVSSAEDPSQVLLEGVHTPYGRHRVDHLVDMRILPKQDGIFI